MNDIDIIQSAYAATLTTLFSGYFSALVSAEGHEAAEAQAGTNFQKGLALARRTREQAIAFVKPSAA